MRAKKRVLFEHFTVREFWGRLESESMNGPNDFRKVKEEQTTRFRSKLIV